MPNQVMNAKAVQALASMPSREELLAIESIRLIVIATPNQSHYGLAKQCLLAGKDVVVDKRLPAGAGIGQRAVLHRQVGDPRGG